MTNSKKVLEKYRQLHQEEPLLVRSPGRINLIGEHTDYNLGPVLPAAINKNIYLAIGARSDSEINIYAADYSDQYIGDLKEIKSAWKLWPNYVLGVINELKKAGAALRGVNIVMGGDIPLAAGLSSSAAITCATAFALNALFDLGYSRLELAMIAQRAEHNFVGVHCGLMDQFASLFGKEGHLIKLDCKTNSFEYIPFSSNQVNIILFDTGVKHHLISSAYNERRQECQRGLEIIKRHVPSVIDLTDVTEKMLYDYVRPESEVIFDRCLYVVQEISRLEKACQHLSKGEFEDLGRLMFETHEGLQNLYQVSCVECDYLVKFGLMNSHILGSRMMGAGFGGCTINLIYGDFVDSVINDVKASYKKEFGKDLKIYNVSLGNGSSVEQVLVDS